jgi:hypothetical protein
MSTGIQACPKRISAVKTQQKTKSWKKKQKKRRKKKQKRCRLASRRQPPSWRSAGALRPSADC